MNKAIEEIKASWQRQNKDLVEKAVREIAEHPKTSNIVCIGAGRMGYSIKAFSMRLMHLGYQSYFIGEPNLPSINNDTLVIINSHSGETDSVVLYAEKCRAAGAKMIGITQREGSRIAKISDTLLHTSIIESEQCMKTLAEQYTYLLLDYIVSELIVRIGVSHKEIEDRHSILE